jgi:hypothetical protein
MFKHGNVKSIERACARLKLPVNGDLFLKLFKSFSVGPCSYQMVVYIATGQAHGIDPVSNALDRIESSLSSGMTLMLDLCEQLSDGVESRRTI